MRAALLLVLLSVCAAASARTFIHPGIDVSAADIARARRLVADSREPWKGCFEALRSSPYSRLDARPKPRGAELTTIRCNGTIGVDGRRAHDLALLYRLTDDVRYAQAAVRFLVANSRYARLDRGGTVLLDYGKVYLLVEAAELLRDFPGWAEEERLRFAAMLREVFYPVLKNGDPKRFGNQGLFAFRAVLAMAVYLEDGKMYDRVWRYLNGLPHRADDEPYPPGPPVADQLLEETAFQRTYKWTACSDRVPDYGYDEQLRHYIYANGQCQESSRDQAHVMAGLFQYVAIAETFWLQGDDLYGALDCRLLLGLEWNLRYNFGDWEPTGFTSDEKAATFGNGLFYQVRHRSGRWQSLAPSPHLRPRFGGPGSPRECAYAHYRFDKKLPAERMAWLRKALERENAENGGFETWGAAPHWFYEWSGWGTLMKRRPE